MSDYQSQLSHVMQNRQLINENAKTYEVRSPVTGIIQGMNTIYKGGMIQEGEIICLVSPESELIGETYVLPKDIGLLYTGQSVVYSIDAFDYNLFGNIEGDIISIDSDFTLIDNSPFFKVRCSFNTQKLSLKNGYTGNLKKGLTFQCRFVIGERTLWQLLWDKMDDWLNPAAPSKISL